MNQTACLEVGSRFWRDHDDAGYLLAAVDAADGRVLHADVAPRPDAAHWTRFLNVLKSDGLSPLGIVHPGNPPLEEALDAVFHGIPRQLCTRHFLSSLYQYLRSFQAGPMGPCSVETRFFRAVSRLLKASTEDRAFQLYYSLIRTPEFAAPELESPLSWLKERFPLLAAHYRVPGLPSQITEIERLFNHPLPAGEGPLRAPLGEGLS